MNLNRVSNNKLCKFLSNYLTNLTSKPSMNVLGVEFDSKLEWNVQVNKTINKAKKTYHAINLIKKYFNSNELKGLLTSNYKCQFKIRYHTNDLVTQ